MSIAANYPGPPRLFCYSFYICSYLYLLLFSEGKPVPFCKMPLVIDLNQRWDFNILPKNTTYEAIRSL
jgi:hypothetical protein